MPSNQPPKPPRAIRILNFITVLVFSFTTIVGLVMTADSATRASGILIIIVSLIGVFFGFVGRIARRLWKVQIPFSVLLLLDIFAFLAVVPGEIFNFYYSVAWWDIFLHLFAGFGVSYIIYKICKTVLSGAEIRRKSVFLAVVSALASLGGAVLWEVAEFSIDSSFQTNMQKFIPAQFLPHNTGSVEAITATDTELATYYRQPTGYRYALMDTMEDHLCYLAGVLIFLAAYGIHQKHK